MSFNLGSAHGEIVIDYNGAGVQQAMGDLTSLSQQGTNLLRAGAGVTAFGAAIGGALLGATNQAADFQFQMDAVNAALGGLDASGMEQVTQQALDLGAATKFSAGEVAGVQEQLAKMGLSADEVTANGEGATKAVLDLASATGEQLGPAATAVGAALNLFDLDAAQTADVADILTAALNESSATLPDLQRGINNLGPVFANLNRYVGDGEGAFRDTAAAVAYFNSLGLKAADAGVSIARGMTDLATPTSKATAEMNRLGISAFDAQGNLLPLPELMDNLAAGMSNMSDKDRIAALSLIFGAEAADVMNDAIRKGGDGLREYEKNTEAAGQAAEQAAIRQDNLRGALENLGGSIQTAAIALGTPFLGPLQAAAQALTNLVNVFIGLPPEVQAAIAGFAALASAILLVGGGAITAAGAILRFGPAFAAAFAAAAPFLAIMAAIAAAIGIGILAYKTDFLGFGKAVDKALSNAQRAIKTFGSAFEDAFSEDKAAGLNDIAAGIAAFGTALQAATGIDITDQFRAAADAVQAFGDAFAFMTDQGQGPVVATLDGITAALASLGLDEAARKFGELTRATMLFGTTFDLASNLARQTGFNDIAASIIGLGDALQAVTGLPVADFFQGVADAVQVFGTSFQTARADGLDPFSASLIALRDTLTQLTGIDLASVFDDLGTSIQSASDGVQTFVQTLRAGDISGALDQITSAFTAALSGLRDQLGQIATTIGTTLAGLVVDLTDWVLNVAAPTLQGWITTAGAWLGEHIRAAVSGAGGALAELSNWILTVAAPTLQGWTNAAGGWLSTTISGIVDGLSGISVTFNNWVLTIDPPSGDNITVDASGIASAIGTALNGALDSIDVNTILDVASFSSKIGAAFHDAFAAVTDAIVTAAQAIGSPEGLASVGEAVTIAMTALGAAAIAAVVGFAAGFVVGEEVDFSAFAESIRGKFEEAINSIGELLGGGGRGQGVIGTLGGTSGILQGLSDQIFEMFNTAAADIAQRVATIDWTAIPKAVAKGIGDALANFGDQLFGANKAEAAGETFDPAKAGTAFGDQLVKSFQSEEFVGAVQAAVDQMPAETFNAIGTGIMTKISEAVGTSMETPKTDELTGAPTGAGDAMGAQLVQNITTGLRTAIDSAPAEIFTAIGTSLITKIQGAISAAMTTASAAGGGGGAPVGADAAGGMGAQLVTSLATSIASSITAAPIEAFSVIGTALQTKISEVLATAMQVSGGGATPQAGLGGTGGGGGIGAAIAQSIATAVAGADFGAVATALQTNLGTAVTTAMTQISTTISTSTNVWITTFITTFTAMSQAALSGMAAVTTSVQTGLQAISTSISTWSNLWISTIITSVAAMQASLDGFAASAAAAGEAAGSGFADGMTAGMAAAQAAAQAAVDAIIAILQSAAAGAEAAGAAVGEGFAAGMEASLGRVQAAAAAMADAAAAGLAAAAQIASPSRVTMAMGQEFGAGFALGIEGATPMATERASSMAGESLRALADSLRSNAEGRADAIRGRADEIRQRHGALADDLGREQSIQTTGSVFMDGREMGDFIVETSIGGMTRVPQRGARRAGMRRP